MPPVGVVPPTQAELQEMVEQLRRDVAAKDKLIQQLKAKDPRVPVSTPEQATRGQVKPLGAPDTNTVLEQVQSALGELAPTKGATEATKDSSKNGAVTDGEAVKPHEPVAPQGPAPPASASAQPPGQGVAGVSGASDFRARARMMEKDAQQRFADLKGAMAVLPPSFTPADRLATLVSHLVQESDGVVTLWSVAATLVLGVSASLLPLVISSSGAFFESVSDAVRKCIAFVDADASLHPRNCTITVLMPASLSLSVTVQRWFAYTVLESRSYPLKIEAQHDLTKVLSKLGFWGKVLGPEIVAGGWPAIARWAASAEIEEAYFRARMHPPAATVAVAAVASSVAPVAQARSPSPARRSQETHLGEHGRSPSRESGRSSDRSRSRSRGRQQPRRSVSRAGRGGARSYKCYNCGGKGHFKRDCPSAARSKEDRVGGTRATSLPSLTFSVEKCVFVHIDLCEVRTF